MFKSFASTVLASMVAATSDFEFTSLGQFKVKGGAAFINMSRFEEESDPFLLVSSFGMIESGKVYVVPGIKEALAAGDATTLEPVLLDTASFEWPNNVAVVPMDVFDERAIVVPDGFLVPTKKTGGIYIVRMDSSDITQTVETVKITEHKRNYFYHNGYWVDLNGDGRKDFITARSNAKKGKGELVWLEHPEGGLSSG